jgi:hypothetical protein
VTFTATVSAKSPGSGTPTGTVTFKDGTTVLGTGTLNSNGQATFTTSSLKLGNHSITAVYGGDTDFRTSTSAALVQTVNAMSPNLLTPSDALPGRRGAVPAPAANGPRGTTPAGSFAAVVTGLQPAEVVSSGPASLTTGPSVLVAPGAEQSAEGWGTLRTRTEQSSGVPPHRPAEQDSGEAGRSAD